MKSTVLHPVNRRSQAAPIVHAGTRPVVLLVDDDAAVVRALEASMRSESFEVVTATTVDEAFALLNARQVDVVVSDDDMPVMRGTDFLASVRHSQPDVARIMVTGQSSPEATMAAINRAQVFRLHLKPCDGTEVARSINEAIEQGVERSALRSASSERRLLTARFDTALVGASLVLQPIVTSSNGSVYGYEMLIRVNAELFATTTDFVRAATQLNRILDLDRTVRIKAATLAAHLPRQAVLFINLTAESLLDDQLYAATSPLRPYARRVVFEVTERSRLDQIPEIEQRVARLRTMHYRFAVDDLGAGYAGLTSLAVLAPEVVKFDAALVRRIESSSCRQKLVGSLVRYCHEANTLSLAEAVETDAEAKCMRELGCDLLQGYLFGRPAAWGAEQLHTTSAA